MTNPGEAVVISRMDGAKQTLLTCGFAKVYSGTRQAPDALNVAGARLGRDSLFSQLRADLSAEVLLAQISQELTEYMTGADQFDDITLLAVRRLPVGE